MDDELRRYLNAVIALLSLTVGLLATQIIVSSAGVSISFLLVPAMIAVFVGLAVVVFLGLPVGRSP